MWLWGQSPAGMALGLCVVQTASHLSAESVPGFSESPGAGDRAFNINTWAVGVDRLLSTQGEFAPGFLTVLLLLPTWVSFLLTPVNIASPIFLL